jgi:hypothetical protein
MICSFETPLLMLAESRSTSVAVAVTSTLSVNACNPRVASTTVSWPSWTFA